MLDGAWVTGVIDRLVVVRDASGQARKAVVYDFKTDAVGDAAEVRAAIERHRTQLEWYRRATAILAGLSLESVTAELVPDPDADPRLTAPR